MPNLFIPFLSILLLVSISVKGQRKGDPPPAKPGLEINRSYVIKQMQIADSSLVFAQGIKINGESVMKGTDKDGSSLEIMGEESYLKKAAFIFKFTLDKNINLLQYQRMAYFTFLLAGNDGVKWLEDSSAEFVRDKTKAIRASKNFNYNRKATYDYTPANKSIIVSFTEW